MVRRQNKCNVRINNATKKKAPKEVIQSGFFKSYLIICDLSHSKYKQNF